MMFLGVADMGLWISKPGFESLSPSRQGRSHPREQPFLSLLAAERPAIGQSWGSFPPPRKLP